MKAIPKVLKKEGITLDDIDLIEVNESLLRLVGGHRARS